ncbi:unnamed protein product [Trypanosoma congolense IL3000]|uniref:WGS project CAEQ00000000 data, annotated contig 2092 n=1 Tax=Trypanosoma congolense (strain IL3000) TaxID=1068625 RepID=F9WBD7_TRYCI|nr:unnamed protein product [Trypanosoma congolense IL3000]
MIVALVMLLVVSQRLDATPGAAVSEAAGKLVCTAAFALERVEQYATLKMNQSQRIITSLKLAHNNIKEALVGGRYKDNCTSLISLMNHADKLSSDFESLIPELGRLGLLASSRAALAAGRLREFITAFYHSREGRNRCITLTRKTKKSVGEFTIHRCVSTARDEESQDSPTSTGYNFVKKVTAAVEDLFTLEEDISMTMDNGCNLTRMNALSTGTEGSEDLPEPPDGAKWAGGLLQITKYGPKWVSDIEKVPVLYDAKVKLDAFEKMVVYINDMFSNFVGVLWTDAPSLMKSSEMESLIFYVSLRTFMAPPRGFSSNEKELSILREKYCNNKDAALRDSNISNASLLNDEPYVSPRDSVLVTPPSRSATVFGDETMGVDYNIVSGDVKAIGTAVFALSVVFLLTEL